MLHTYFISRENDDEKRSRMKRRKLSKTDVLKANIYRNRLTSSTKLSLCINLLHIFISVGCFVVGYLKEKRKKNVMQNRDRDSGRAAGR